MLPQQSSAAQMQQLKLNQTMEKLQPITNAIASGMSAAITGVIDGTKTVEEAMSEMFANIGKAFIDMATQMIAKALVMKALGILTHALVVVAQSVLVEATR